VPGIQYIPTTMPAKIEPLYVMATLQLWFGDCMHIALNTEFEENANHKLNFVVIMVILTV
jgi:hypothetical protein